MGGFHKVVMYIVPKSSKGSKAIVKRLTLEAFFVKLRRVKREWGFKLATIRTMEDECPVTAVCAALTGRHYDVGNWEDAAENIKLRHSTARRIVRAADGSEYVMGGDWALRDRILEACRLKECGSK